VYAQFGQFRGRIAAQLGVIRQHTAMIEAYEMDGWRGARCVRRVAACLTRQQRHQPAKFPSKLTPDKTAVTDPHLVSFTQPNACTTSLLPSAVWYVPASLHTSVLFLGQAWYAS
jgi:hypothetical protein